MLRAIVELPGSTLASDPWPSPLPSHIPLDGNDNSHHNDDPSDNLQEWSSLIGIITAIVGNVLIALALNVQRYAHIKLHKERHRMRRRARDALKRAHNGSQPSSYGTIGNGNSSNGYQHSTSSLTTDSDHETIDDSRETDPLRGSFHSHESNDTACESDDQEKGPSSYLRSPYWWLGQVLITLGEMGNFLAYGFAPASIVSPIGVVALISNCIIAPAMFHEKFRQRDYWGVVIAVGGVVTVVLSANQEETKLNPHDVWDAITTLAFEIYLGVTTLLIIILMWLSPRYGRNTILIDLGLVGLFGGYTALATKGVSSMLSSTLWRAFTTPVTYVLILILLLTAIMQIRYVNKALQRFDSTQVIPIQFVMFTLCVIIGSAILYRDFERTTTEQAAKFVGGCLLTFFGVFLITSGRDQSRHDDDALSDAEGIEETIGLSHHDHHDHHDYHDGNPAPLEQNAHDIQALKSASRSRRSSRLSQTGDAETGRLLTPYNDGGIPPTKVLGVNGSQNSPGQDAAVHSNPWQDMGAPSTPPGRGIRTISTDSVVTAPGGGNGGGSTTAPSNLTTPLRDAMASDGALVRPSISPTKSGGHRSRTFISPSPLASTVTAVVKDAFLRNTEDSRLKPSSMRRFRSQLRAGLFGDDNPSADPSSPTDAAALPQSAVVHASEDALVNGFGEADSPAGNGLDALGRRRARSLSDTLGDFFGVYRKPAKGDQLASDNEDGTADLGESAVATDPRFESDATIPKP